MKRILLIVGAVIFFLLVAAGVLMAVTFGGNKPLQDGQELAGGARLVKDGVVAAYLLPAGDKEVVLVDCGNDAGAGPILATLRQRGLDASAVKAIFITHAHPDHIAGCHNFPQAQVYAFPADQGLAAGTETAHSPLAAVLPAAKGPVVKVTHPLADGEMVTAGNLQVRAFAVPGHTGGSAAYLASGVLYLGDSAMIATDGSLRPAPWLFSDDTAQNRASLKKLTSQLVAEVLEVKQLACAHSGPGEGLKPLTDFQP